jgi:CubicO group peptidase (beta-lactamase class C family)
MRSVIAFLLGASVAPALSAQQPPTARLDSIFADYQGTDRPGCAVAVSRDGKVLAAKGYGMADLAQGLAINPNSVFHIASVSKQFAGMTLALLAASGKVSLDDDIRKYVPEIPSYGMPITIRHLLTHTSGIRDQWSLLMMAGWRLGEDIITEKDVLEILSRQKGLNFAPGTDWLYSNSGFTLAAVIVKRATGQSIRRYSDSVLFRPLGMSRTHWHDDNSMVVPGRTRGYGMWEGEWHEFPPHYSTVGATSLFTTVMDFVQWHRELDEATVGGRAALDALERRGVLASGDTLQYALGITHGTYRGQPTLSHGGGDAGYRTHLLHFPALKAGVTVFCNRNQANPSGLAEKTADLFFGADFQPVRIQGDSLAGGALAKATGLYWNEQTEDAARVVVANGRLGWETWPDTTWLRRLSDTRYLLDQAGTRLDVLPDGTIRYGSDNGESSKYVKVADWTPTQADRAALVGRYASDELGTTWSIRLTGDTLTLERRKYEPARMRPVMKDTWLARDWVPTFGGHIPYLIRAERDKSGRVVGILVGSGRVRRLELKRVPSE